MIYIVLLILICIYIATARLIPISFAVLGILIGIWILNGILCAIANRQGKKVKYTETMKKNLEDAEREDLMADTAARADLKNRERNIRAAGKDTINRLQREIADNNERIAVSKALLKEMDILAPDDMNLETVDALIKLLDGRRAQNISEALRLHDANKAAEYQARVQRQAAEFQRKMAEMHARQQAEREREQYWENWAHQRKMEMLEERKLKELEQIRKDQEEYLRR